MANHLKDRLTALVAGIALKMNVLKASLDSKDLDQVLTVGAASSVSITIDKGNVGSYAAIATFKQNGGSLYFSNGTSATGSFIPSITASSLDASGVYAMSIVGKGLDSYNRGIVLSTRNALGTGNVTSGRIFSVSNYNTDYLTVDYNGATRLANLAGTGTRMVTADNTGLLSASQMPVITETDPVYTADKPNILAKINFPTNQDFNQSLLGISFTSASGTFTNMPSWWPANDGIIAALTSSNSRSIYISAPGDGTTLARRPEIKWGTLPAASSAWYKLAFLNDIPTNNNQLTNGSGYITSVPAQTWTSITGKPTFAAVATSGSYNDLSNKPNIPTVNNATIIIKNGTTVLGSFTTNQAAAADIDISSAITTIGVNGYSYGEDNDVNHNGWDTNGGFASRTRYIAASSYTIQDDDHKIYSGIGNTNIALPNPANYAGRELYIFIEKPTSTSHTVSFLGLYMPTQFNDTRTAVTSIENNLILNSVFDPVSSTYYWFIG